MGTFDLSVISWNAGMKDDKVASTEAANKLIVSLHDKLRKREKGNFLYSSSGISSALAVVRAGARENTTRQICKALNWEGIPVQDLHDQMATFLEAIHAVNSRQIELQMATGLFVQKGIAVSEEFREIARKHYGVEVTEVDFKKNSESARRDVNTWVKQQLNDSEAKVDTNKKSGVNCSTKCVLVNTMTFKGVWLSGLWRPQIDPSTFFLKPGKGVKVHMIKQLSNFRYCTISNLGRKGCQLLEVPLKEDSLSVVFLLPVAKLGLDALADVENSLTFDTLRDVLEGASYIPPVKVEVSIPASLVLHEERQLKDTLVSLGVTDLWSQSKSDLTGFRQEAGKLHLSNVFHKTCVEIAAESDVSTRVSTVAEEIAEILDTQPTEHVFSATQPFLFFVSHKSSGAILLSGRVVNPLIVTNQTERSSSCVLL